MKTLYTLTIVLLTLNIVNAQFTVKDNWSRALIASSLDANGLGTDTIHKAITDFQADSLIDSNASNENFVILDIRRPTEIMSGYIKNAEFINFEDPNFSSLVNDLDRNKIYLVYCQSGGRSGQAFDLMVSMKFREVYNMLNGFKKWKTDNLPYVIDSATNLNNYKMFINDFSTYPNPATDQLTFECNNPSVSGILSVYNLNGQEQMKQPMKQKSDIDISSLPSGVYILRFSNNQTVETIRFVKQ